MLRITVRTATDPLVLELEGCVAGPWVAELAKCWHELAGRGAGRPVQVDLRSVCHVDRRGRDLMQRMYDQGAAFIATGCVMPEMVRELAVRAPASSSAART
jgi:hypothetical protein